MGFLGRIRFKLITAMIVVALAALVLNQYAAALRREAAARQAELAARRQAQLALLAAELLRNEARLKWSTAMHKKGYVSETQVTSDRQQVEVVRSRLGKLGTPK